MTLSRKSLFVLAATFAFAPAAGAATDTGNVIVTATVANGCVIDAGAVDFGPYDTQDVNDDTAIGDVSVTCNAGTTATIRLGQGVTPTAASTPAVPVRQMTGSVSGFLRYHLYQDAVGTVWGDTLLTSADYTGSGVAEDVVIHGTIPALQAAVGGNYIDTVVATITF